MRPLILTAALSWGLLFSVPLHSQSAHLHHGQDDVAFLERSPRIGEAIPDVRGYDEQGREISLRDLGGHYTALICGCLT